MGVVDPLQTCSPNAKIGGAHRLSDNTGVGVGGGSRMPWPTNGTLSGISVLELFSRCRALTTAVSSSWSAVVADVSVHCRVPGNTDQ